MNGTVTMFTYWRIHCAWCGWEGNYPEEETAIFVLRCHEQNCGSKP